MWCLTSLSPRSIESWFDVKVEGALDAGLNLGRATMLDTLAD
jgi:nitrogen fixation/metabolism regulation signal transduction histidine kinase